MNVSYLTADEAAGTSHQSGSLLGSDGSAGGYASSGGGGLYVQTPPRAPPRRPPAGRTPSSYQSQTSPRVIRLQSPVDSPWTSPAPSSLAPGSSQASASPNTLYDRRDQVGLGELTTPRWMMSQANPDTALPQRVLPLDSPGQASTTPVASQDRTPLERNSRAISYSLGKHSQASLMPSFASMQFDDLGVGVPSPSLESMEESVNEAPARRSGTRLQPSPAATNTPSGLAVRQPRASQGMPSAQQSSVMSSPSIQGMLSDMSDDVYHVRVSPLSSSSQTQPFQGHYDSFGDSSSSIALPTLQPTVTLERSDTVQAEPLPPPPPGQMVPPSPAQQTTSPPSPSPQPLAPTQTTPQEASPRAPKSPRWRLRNTSSHVDDHEDSSSLAGRLSRRSLMALGSLFKTSPRRASKEKDDTHDVAVQGESGTTSSSPLRSRLSFTRRRRQSLQSVRSALPRAKPANAASAPEPDVPAAPLQTPTKNGAAAPSIPPKSSRREGADVVHPLRTEPSPYYTAKAHGSRIPRASSMMRVLSRNKIAESDDARVESRIPVSASMNSISSSSDFSSVTPTPSMHQRQGSMQQRDERASRTLNKGIDASPMRLRAARKSHASTEAAEALRRHHAIVAHAMHAESEAPQASTNKTATLIPDPRLSTATAHIRSSSASTTPTTYTASSESNIPVPTADMRRRAPSAPSRRNTARSPVDDTQMADEEMERHIQRMFRRKLAAGARHEDLEKQLAFPQPTAPSKRLSPRQAEVLFGNHLCPYEQDEIHQYDSIFYVGLNARHKHYAVLEKPDRNYGYDDERGDYIVNARDHLAYRYEIIKLLGRGSFGQVLQCLDHKTGQYVAIKLIRNKRRFQHQATVEVKIMEHLTRSDPKGQHHVVHMTDSFTFRHHLCVTMELLSINLYELIKANSFEGFSSTLIRRFAQQTLMCLTLMRQAQIVHCDLKPENILLVHPRRSEVRVIDFGSSCYVDERVYTYIQSRFYRSPEVILGMEYHMAIDMWSLGCILAELYTGYPIFPGESENDQLACIMEVLGVPDKHLLDKSTRTKLFFDSTGAPRPVVTSRGHRRRPSSKSLAAVLRTSDEWFLDFVARCLTWDPERRIKADAALNHPWFLQRTDSAIPRVPRARRAVRPDTARAEGSMLPRATPASLRS